ncbi:MAG: hypothetical protein QM790_06550 [Nibricoccus sp.]
MRYLRLAVIFSLVAVGCTTVVPYAKRIEQSEQSGVCYVHHEPMKKKRLRIIYGLVAFRKEWTDARLSLFPFAHRAILGGCVITKVIDHPELSSPEYGEDYVCTRCSEAKARWISNHLEFEDQK